MKKKTKRTCKLRRVIGLTVMVSMLSGCAAPKTQEPETAPERAEQAVDAEADTASSTVQTEQGTEVSNVFYAGSRPQLIQTSLQGDAAKIGRAHV